jgi:hypothetical protein
MPGDRKREVSIREILSRGCGPIFVSRKVRIELFSATPGRSSRRPPLCNTPWSPAPSLQSAETTDFSCGPESQKVRKGGATVGSSRLELMSFGLMTPERTRAPVILSAQFGKETISFSTAWWHCFRCKRRLEYWTGFDENFHRSAPLQEGRADTQIRVRIISDFFFAPKRLPMQSH